MDDLLKQYCDIAKRIAIEEGRAEGIAKGRAEGISEGKFDIAKRMLMKGKTTAEIVDITELSLAAVQKLQAEMLQHV